MKLFLYSLHIECSYRTYEEWKQKQVKNFQAELSSSYRTYEEWKQYIRCCCANPFHLFLPYLWGMETVQCAVVHQLIQGSYRTYEEWKQLSAPMLAGEFFQVLTVPMRNGNLLYYQ